jgi:hypothetical protein
MGFLLSVICCGRPIVLDKPHILALAAETGFLLFKEQVPLNFKKEISAVQCERKTFRLISLSTPVSFRWTVPLKGQSVSPDIKVYFRLYQIKSALSVGPLMFDNFLTFTILLLLGSLYTYLFHYCYY